MKNIDLSVDFAGVRLKNPFVIGSGAVSCDAKRIIGNMDRIVDAGWAGVVLKSLGNDEKMVQDLYGAYPHLYPVKRHGRKGTIGMQNYGPTISLIEDVDLESVIKAGHQKGLVIIPSIQATAVKDFVYLAKMVEKSGAEIVEVNYGCPMDPDKVTLGEEAQFDLNPRLAEEGVKAIKSECKIKVIVKQGPNLVNLSPVSQAIERGGADGISAVNTLLGLSGIDIETGIPLSASANKLTILSGLSGEIIRPIALRCVAQAVRSVNIPVFGIGGITNWQSAVEFLMIGATALQICTYALERGFKVVGGLLKKLTEFMEKHDYNSIADFRGISQKYITDDFYALNEDPVRALINAEKCNLCGLCATACADGTTGAITVNNTEAIVDGDLCIGCGLCRIVCPVDAIEMGLTGAKNPRSA